MHHEPHSNLMLSNQFASMTISKLASTVACCVAILISFFATSPVNSQVLPGTKKPTARGQKPKIVIPEPEIVTIESDGFSLKCMYLAPPLNEQDTEARKKSVPFIVLHDWEASGGQTAAFGKFLQASGHAAIVPELRGHGGSTTLQGKDTPVNFDDFGKLERSLVINDIEACKRFLVQRNNEGELNIDLLNVVAVGEICPVAAQWAIKDWSFSEFNSKGIKQGRDVRGLIMVSPKKRFGTFNMTQLLKHPLFTGGTSYDLPVMLVWGADDDASSKDASSIDKLLKKARPEVPEDKSAEEALAIRSLFTAEIKSSPLSGNELISKQSVDGLWAYMAKTMSAKALTQIEKRPWVDRSKKVEKKK